MPQERNISPIREHEQEGSYMNDIDYYEGCGCFKLFFCFNNGRGNNNGETSVLLQGKGDQEETWFEENLQKMKQFSERLAGPKWKNFIRRFRKKSQRTLFQYSPESYAMNFDDGEEDDYSTPLPREERRPVGL